MRLTSLNLPQIVGLLLLGAIGLLLPRPAAATQLYNNPGPFVQPWINPTGAPSLPPPAKVPGKEYSHDLDSTTVGAIGAPPPADAEQVIAWDGLGGAQDGIDYSDSPRPDYSTLGEVDALAFFCDSLFLETLEDRAHLIFSVSDSLTRPITGLSYAVPSVGPLNTVNGGNIGGAGELSYELAGFYAPPNTHGTWATQATVNAMPGPTDLDAVELWGPEPDLEAEPPLLGDSNRYSLANDFASGVSVWKLKKNPDDSYTSLPYVTHSLVVAAVLAQLGQAESIDEQELIPLIDLDALMTYDMPGSDTGLFSVAGDRILFSIRQIVDSADASGYYATGSEIFWLDGTGASGILHHGGHDWDKSYALDSLSITTPLDTGVLDLNALEAVAVVPEPGAATFVWTLVAILGWWSRRGHSRACL